MLLTNSIKTAFIDAAIRLNIGKKNKINQDILAIISSPNSEHLSFVAPSISL